MRRRRLHVHLGLFLGLVLAAAAACGGPEGETGGAPHGGAGPGTARPASTAVLRFSGIPDQDATRLKEAFDPLARYLAGALGVAVEYVPTTKYAASVEMFANGQIHLAWFGGLTGVQARHLVPGARAIAQGEEDPLFYSYLIAHRDTGLERAEAFPLGARGMTFAFGSPQSTSGRLMPEHFIREATGGAPEDFFDTVTFSGDHDRTWELVQAGSVQVGAINYTVYDQRVQEGRIDPEVCRIVWKTPTYADYNFTVRPDVDDVFGAGFGERLQRALLELDDPAILAALARKRLIAAKNEDFAGVRQVAEALGFLD